MGLSSMAAPQSGASVAGAEGSDRGVEVVARLPRPKLRRLGASHLTRGDHAVSRSDSRDWFSKLSPDRSGTRLPPKDRRK